LFLKRRNTFRIFSRKRRRCGGCAGGGDTGPTAVFVKIF
jgi:hypothetical protein